MAVIFAVVGGGAVVGIATADPYSDHSNYGDYSDWHEYSDAAERRQRRIDEKNKEIENQKYEINTYKTQNVNQHLQTNSLIQQDGVSVSVQAVQQDGDDKIRKAEEADLGRESGPLQAEIDEIDKVIDKIDQILSEDN